MKNRKINKVTSVTMFSTAEGTRISVTYSIIDEDGKIISENKRVNRIVVDDEALSKINDINTFAKSIVDAEQSDAKGEIEMNENTTNGNTTLFVSIEESRV